MQFAVEDVCLRPELFSLAILIEGEIFISSLTIQHEVAVNIVYLSTCTALYSATMHFAVALSTIDV